MTNRNCWRCGTAPLSPRSLRILCLLADPAELTIEEIGGRMGLSRQSIKNRLTRIYHALGVKGRTGAVLKVIELALKEPAHE